MTSICFYFQVHQPYRLGNYRFFDIGHHDSYFDSQLNREVLQRVAQKCYIPMNRLLLDLIEQHHGDFRCAFSVSTTALTQMEHWCPEALQSFVDLSKTGSVEFLAETSHHSLTAMFHEDEFRAQVRKQRDHIEHLFGQKPTVFRNTELVLSNHIAKIAHELGFSGILGEGAERLLNWRSPHYVYHPAGCEAMAVLLRSYRLSDDIAFRFSNRSWAAWPLFADTFARWVHNVPRDDQFIGLFMDYETFGEHQWEDTGIFDFMRHLPREILRAEHFNFRTPSQVIQAHPPVGVVDVQEPVSWADAERDLTAWLGNEMQRAAARALYNLVEPVHRAAGQGRMDLLENWRRLSTSDHVYYMCTKYDQDGDVHKYFSPHGGPHEAFIAFMNAVDDLRRRLREFQKDHPKQAQSWLQTPAKAKAKAEGGEERESPQLDLMGCETGPAPSDSQPSPPASA